MLLGIRRLAHLLGCRIKERLWASKPKVFAQDSAEDKLSLKQNMNHDETYGQKPHSESIQSEGLDEDFRITLWLSICLSVLFLVSFMSAMDYTSIGTVVSTISSDLGGTTSQSEWIGNGYSLTSCVSQLPISTLADVFGHRVLLIFTTSMFLIGSIICGTAQNMTAMIAGRIIQGIGSAGNLVLPEIVLASTIPLRLRGMYYSMFMFVWSLGASVGPIIAGSFAEYATWRWMFYLNIPVCGLALAGTPFIKLSKHEQNWKDKLKQIDYVGALLVIASSTSLVLGLARGGSSSSLPWTKWSVILPIVLGALGIIATGLYEFYAKIPHPMFNVRVFGNLTASMCYVQNVLQGIIYMAAVFYLPTFFQGAKGLGQLMSGVAILPLSLVGPPISVIIGWIITRTGHYALMNYLLWALSLVGVGLITLMNEHSSLAMLMCIQIPASMGLLCLYATLSITVNACNPPELWVDSTAMMSFCRSIGDALGTAVGGAIFASEMKQRISRLADQGINISESSSALTVSEYIQHLGPSKLRDALVNALVCSMHTTYIVLTIFTGVAFSTCFLQHEYSLDATYKPQYGVESFIKESDEQENVTSQHGAT